MTANEWACFGIGLGVGYLLGWVTWPLDRWYTKYFGRKLNNGNHKRR